MDKGKKALNQEESIIFQLIITCKGVFTIWAHHLRSRLYVKTLATDYNVVSKCII